MLKLRFILFLILAMPLHAEKTQMLACSYYDKLEPALNASLIHPGLSWVWAKGLNSEKICLNGEKNDGFYEVNEVISCEGIFTSFAPVYYANSSDTAMRLCENALREAYPDSYESKVIVSMMAKSSFLSINSSPPVFHELAQGKQHGINKIVVFGDSLSDQGNLKSWFRLLLKSPYMGGRFTNGPNWLDYLHMETGIAIQNWSMGGAVTDIKANEYHRISTKIAGSVSDEIKRYRQQLGDDDKINNLASTLFIIWTGGNDYLSKLYSKNSMATFIDKPDDQYLGYKICIKNITENIINHVQTLYDIGARNFLVINMPDLGAMPEILNLQYYHRYSKKQTPSQTVKLSRTLTKISNLHNERLQARLNSFSKTYFDAQITYGNVYNGLRNVMTAKHFFNHTRRFSYQLDPDFIWKFQSNPQTIQIHQPCYTGSVWGQDCTSTVCPYPEKTLFWDNIHPSSFGHCLIGLGIHKRLFSNQVLSDPDSDNYLQRCRPELSL